MAKELESAQSILWMMVELKDHGSFTYEAWAQRFRRGDPVKAPRDDRKFHHHLRFLREDVLPELQPEGGRPLTASGGRYTATTRFDDDSFGYLSGENVLPFLHGLNQVRHLVPFPSLELETELVDVLDVDRKTLGSVLYKNSFQWRFDPKFLATFLDAVHQKRQLRVTSRAPRERCELTPLFLVNYDGAWYLIGLSHRLEQFNLSRVDGLDLTDSSSAPMPPQQLADLRRSIQDTFGVYLVYDWPGNGTGELVRVRYRGRALPYADERFDERERREGDTWFEVERHGGVIDVTLKVNSRSEILSEVLRWGADAEALSPEAFRQEWLERLREMRALLAAVEGNKENIS